MLLIFKRYFLTVSLIFVSLYPRSGQLNVGFDIDDTVLFSRDVFLNIPKDKRSPIDYGWVNTHDDGMSIYIDPTVKLINYFISNGHNVLFITARSGENGEALATFLSQGLGFPIKKNMNLFFAPSEKINGKNHTTKHRIMKRLNLDLFYGDGDSDIIAALKAGIHPVRIVLAHETPRMPLLKAISGRRLLHPPPIGEMGQYLKRSQFLVESLYGQRLLLNHKPVLL